MRGDQYGHADFDIGAEWTDVRMGGDVVAVKCGEIVILRRRRRIAWVKIQRLDVGGQVTGGGRYSGVRIVGQWRIREKIETEHGSREVNKT